MSQHTWVLLLLLALTQLSGAHDAVVLGDAPERSGAGPIVEDIENR